MAQKIGIVEKQAMVDDAVSKNTSDFESGSSLVTLRFAQGLSRWASKRFAAARHD